MRRLAVLCLAMATAAAPAAQSPRPFPVPPPPQPATRPPAQERPTSPAPPAPTADGVPTEASLGLPLYPNASFLTSYDAGRGQRHYVFGVVQSFAEIVAYYQTVLKTRGNLLFEGPATHAFDVGRFRDETMAFPPGVTVKDFGSGGSPGYVNPKPGATPTHFPTVIQIVPAPPETPR